MQVDDLLGQGKADAGFSVFSHVEAVKDMGQIFRGNAVPVILYPYRHMTLLRAAGQVCRWLGRLKIPLILPALSRKCI